MLKSNFILNNNTWLLSNIGNFLYLLQTSIFIPPFIFFCDNCNKCNIENLKRCWKTANRCGRTLYRVYCTRYDEILTCIWTDNFMSNSCVANFFILLCSNHSSFIGFNIKLDQSLVGNIKAVILVWNPSSLFDLHRQRKNINFRIVTWTHNSSLHLIFRPTWGTVSFPWGEGYVWFDLYKASSINKQACHRGLHYQRKIVQFW